MFFDADAVGREHGARCENDATQCDGKPPGARRNRQRCRGACDKSRNNVRDALINAEDARLNVEQVLTEESDEQRSEAQNYDDRQQTTLGFNILQRTFSSFKCFAAIEGGLGDHGLK